jgi:hypothetical protein
MDTDYAIELAYANEKLFSVHGLVPVCEGIELQTRRAWNTRIARINFVARWFSGIKMLLPSHAKVEFHNKVYFLAKGGINSCRTRTGIYMNGAYLPGKPSNVYYIVFGDGEVPADSLVENQSLTVTGVPKSISRPTQRIRA